MVALYRRQVDDDALAAPSIDGLSGAATVDPANPTETGLAVDTDAPMVSDSYTVPLVPTETDDGVAGTPGIKIPSSSAIPPTPAPTTSAESSSSDSSGIPIGTTIGICVGVLIGALLVVLLGLWWYKRAAPKPRQRGSSGHGRGLSQNWKKLDEGADSWEGMHKMKEVPSSDGHDGTEKLTTMFKKSPSQRTAYTSKTDMSDQRTYETEPAPFAHYHPALAQEMASTEDLSSTSAPFVKPAPTQSWVSAESPSHSSFLSLRPSYVEGSMSPSVDMAIPTPTVVSSAAPHQWHSAEVVVVDYGDHSPQSAAIEDENPFMHTSEVRRGVQDSEHKPSPLSSYEIENDDLRRFSAGDPVLGEDNNPFSDDHIAAQPSRATVASMASATSNGRAIQSLLAALQVSPEDERTRVMSMQPSIISEMSQYTDNDNMSVSFPSPSHVDKS